MKKNDIWKLTIPVILLTICGIFVLLERRGIQFANSSKSQITPIDELSFSSMVSEEAECLILTAKSEEIGEEASSSIMEFVLKDMRISYDKKDITQISLRDELTKYTNVVIAFDDWTLFGEQLYVLSQWLQNGGHLMNTITPQLNQAFQVMAPKLGIKDEVDAYAEIGGVKIQSDEMIGCSKEGISFDYIEEDGELLMISLDVVLRNDATCYVTDLTGDVPILWSGNYGKGKYVILNESIEDKYLRGFLCFSYSLLDDICIYPVINGSSYYLDDFPDPIPGGNNEYVDRDFGVDLTTFFHSIWWPVVSKWSKDYGIRHTGLIIENYSDDVTAPFQTNPVITHYEKFGRALLNNGGELGIHGYNHQPLCLKGEDEDHQFGNYKLWPSMNDMEESLKNVQQFSETLYPGERLQVYVPPSNIISKNGIKAIQNACPNIKVIASSILKDTRGKVYEQEFGVTEDGMIQTPRITSGGTLDDYQMIMAFSELNFHYVQSHFMHPDDVMDIERGAELGWEELSRRLEEYIIWIKESAPSMRDLRGSEMGTAVSQYAHLSMKRTFKDGRLVVSLGGFSDEAYFLMRVNREIDTTKTKGCSLVHVTGNVYEVHATEPVFEIGEKS